MTVELIDGRAGKPHISGDDLGNFKAGFVGIEGYVLETENKLAATLESANKLTINTGAAIMPTTGRHVRITSPETVTIQSGTQGQKRNDLVVLRTATSSDNTTVEAASIVVIKGTPTTGTPTDPSINNGDLKLYRLSLNGISANDPVPLFNVLTPLATLGASVDSSKASLFLTASTNYIDLNGKVVSPGGTYTAPATGYYVLGSSGTGGANAWWAINGRVICGGNTGNVYSLVPLAKGTVLSTRNFSGANYEVAGYFII